MAALDRDAAADTDTGPARPTGETSAWTGSARPRLHAVIADVTDDEAVRTAIGPAALGDIDILVNNAGIGAIESVEDNDDDKWRHVLDVNVTGRPVHGSDDLHVSGRQWRHERPAAAAARAGGSLAAWDGVRPEPFGK